MTSRLAPLVILLILCGCVDQALQEGEKIEPVPESELSERASDEPEIKESESESEQEHFETPEIPPLLIPLSPEDETAYNKALQDIDRYRKGDVTITILTKDGKPLPDFDVKYYQTDHSFLFGIFTNYNPEVFALLKDAHINYVTFHFNWLATEPEPDTYRFQTLKYVWGIEPLFNQGFTLKAHALTWMCDDTTPEYMRRLSFKQYIEKSSYHIFRIVSHFQKYIHIWNVINEPMAEWANIYNFSEEEVKEAIAKGISAVREADLQGRVIINNASPAGENYIMPPYEFMQGLTGYDIIGLQFYYNGYTEAYEAPRRSLSYLASLIDTFSTLKKEIHITELSVPSEPFKGRPGYWGRPWSEELQAQYAQVAYTLFFSKKYVKAITWWDASDSTSFIYHGGLLDQDNNPKKIYYTLKNLLNSWMTRGVQKTDENGQITFRGFGGSYQVIVTSPEGVILEKTCKIKEQQSNTIQIIFDEESIKNEVEQRKNEKTEELNKIITNIEELLMYWETQGREVTPYREELDTIINEPLEDSLEKARALLLTLAITRESEHNWDTFENTNEDIFDLSWADSGALLTDGILYKQIPLKGTITLKILARGDEGGGRFPTFFVMAGSAVSDVVRITNSQWKWYEVTMDISEAEEIAIIFTDDYYDPRKGEDRNLYIKQVFIIEYIFI